MGNIYFKKEERGFVLLVAVMLSTIILAITMGVLKIASTEIIFSSSAVQTGEAQLAADAGIECALYNDKSSLNKFPLAGPATAINCLNTSITPSFTGTATTASYDFVISGLGSNSQACAIVNVFKDNSVVPMETTVTSKGYNVGNSSCVSTNINRVERAFIATTSDITGLGGGSGGGGGTTYSLFVTRAGTGSGTVTSNLGAINCGSVCSDSFADGTSVTLSQSAAVGSTFTGWSGDADCSDGVVNMTVNVACTATFDLSASFPTVSGTNSSTQSTDSVNHTVSLPASISAGDLLIVIIESDGNPTITWPSGWTQMFVDSVNTGDKFEGRYRIATGTEGASITLTTNVAEQSAHQSFKITGYVGTPEDAMTKSSTSGSTTPDSPALSPSWGSADTLWISVVGRGATAGTTAYPANYTNGLTTAAGAGGTGGTVASAQRQLVASSENPGNFTISSGNVWVAATIAVQGGVSAPITYDLDVSKSGTGSGTVTSSPGSINCGATCTDSFSSSTSVSLSQSAGGSSSFSGWSGDCTGVGACNLTMDANKSVVATFTSSNHLLSISKTGTGSGTVTSNVGSINCGATCSDSYSNGTSVILTASPSGGSNFTGWSGGGCSGTGTCTVSMTSTLTVTANFNLQPIALDLVSDSQIRTSTTTPNNASPITWSHVVGSGNNKILVVTTSQRSAAIPTAVTYGGTPLTMIRSDANSVLFSTMWYLINPPTGTANIAVTYAASPNSFQGNGISLFNVNQTTPIDIHNGANAQSPGPISVNLITSSANTWIVDVVAMRTSATNETLTMSAMTNRVQREAAVTPNTNGLRAGVSTIGPAVSAGSYLLNWTTSHLAGCTNTCMWAISSAAFKQ